LSLLCPIAQPGQAGTKKKNFRFWILDFGLVEYCCFDAKRQNTLKTRK
jgi:hypothetical protein